MFDLPHPTLIAASGPSIPPRITGFAMPALAALKIFGRVLIAKYTVVRVGDEICVDLIASAQCCQFSAKESENRTTDEQDGRRWTERKSNLYLCSSSASI